ncbi:MAG TPA: hypothetical protein VG755_31590 [Nannocystaceae bacterium]|nr:hypothetical protein [Nannocystaceae bacterium]
MAGAIARVWGIAGVVALLAQALVRLGPRAVEALQSELDVVQWIVLVGWCAFMVHAEGIKGFHRRFSPRVVARAWTLERPSVLQLLLAPAYCMSLFHASRRGLVVAWSVLLGVVGLVAIVSRFSQPWRGIVDAGVVLGLGVGLLSILFYTVRAMGGTPPPIAPDLPTQG